MTLPSPLLSIFVAHIEIMREIGGMTGEMTGVIEGETNIAEAFIYRGFDTSMGEM